MRYDLAERPIELPVPARAGAPATTITLRLIVRASPGGHQTPILTNRTDLTAPEVAHRISARRPRRRQENYFRAPSPEHFALDALDGTLDTADDPYSPVPNPAKARPRRRVSDARADTPPFDSARRAVRGHRGGRDPRPPPRHAAGPG